MRGAVCSVHEYLVSMVWSFFICFLSFFLYFIFSFFFLDISIVYELCNTHLIVVVFFKFVCLAGYCLFYLFLFLVCLFSYLLVRFCPPGRCPLKQATHNPSTLLPRREVFSHKKCCRRRNVILTVSAARLISADTAF